jgi:nucleotide-binding universal stress UspA family protein
MSAFRKILVPTDFSRDAREAVRVAHDLASPTGATMVMFHVSRFPALAMEAGRPSSRPAHGDSEGALDKPRAMKAQLPAVRVEHETVVADRPDANQILRIQDERGCDLIVMGTRVRAGRKHRLFGSVTEDVVRRARCPVVVVTAPPDEPEDTAEQTALQPALRVKS